MFRLYQSYIKTISGLYQVLYLVGFTSKENIGINPLTGIKNHANNSRKGLENWKELKKK